MMDPCSQTHRIDRLENDIQELKETDKKHTADITKLKEGQAEGRMFQKLILDQLAEIKMLITRASDATSRKEQTVEKKSNEQAISQKDWIKLIMFILGGTIFIVVARMFQDGGISP